MEVGRTIRSAIVIGGFTTLSRILGLVRDIMMAGMFHTSLAMSSFAVAFTIPNLFRRLFGEGALSAAFVPVFVSLRKEEGDASAWRLAQNIFSLLFVLLTCICLAGMLLAHVGVLLAEPGTKTAVILSLVRIMLPYMIFICLAALSMGVLNSFSRFAVPAATPVLLNLFWIGALVYFVRPANGPLEESIRYVAWAVVLAGAVQLLVQVPALWRVGYRPGFSFSFRDPQVMRVLTLMGPAALGLAVAQVNVLVDKLLAIWVGTWAPAVLFFSERLIYLPLGILATSFSTVLLPVLAGHAADRDHKKMTAEVGSALRHVLFLMIPAAVGLLFLARPIVTLVYQWGEFGSVATTQTVLALQFYAPGLVMFSLTKVFVPAFYANHDTRTPVLIAVACVGLNFVLNVLFVLTWPAPIKHAGLAFATVLASAANGGALAWYLHRRFGSPGWKRIIVSFTKSLVAAAAMGFAAHYANDFVFSLRAHTAFPIKYFQAAGVAAGIAAGLAAYTVASFVLRSEELRGFAGIVFRRRSRAKDSS
jgi:putative peptidoglycan lipid II flippase